MLLLLATLQTAPPPLQVVRLERVTAAPGARDHAAAVAARDGVSVFWEQAAGIDRAAEPVPPVGIWVARLAPAGGTAAALLPGGPGNRWWPAPLAGDPALLAAYEARPEHRTGDRNIVLYRLDSAARRGTVVAQVTRDPPRSPLPINEATPAVARRPDGSIVLAWSAGAYRAGVGYRDKDIRIAVLGKDLRAGATRDLTDSTEAGHEYAPALLPLPGGRLQVVYASDSSAGRYDLYSRIVDSALVSSPPVRVTRSPGGATRPSVAAWSGTPWLSWQDQASNDVFLAPLRPDGAGPHRSLRALLQATDFVAAGVPLAALAGASLFTAGGRLGVAFVATMHLDPARAQVQRDVWVAWLESGEPRGPVRGPAGPDR